MNADTFSAACVNFFLVLTSNEFDKLKYVACVKETFYEKCHEYVLCWLFKRTKEYDKVIFMN